MPRGGLGSRAAWLMYATDEADDRDPDPHHAPARAELQRDAGDDGTEHRSAVEQPVKPDEVPGPVGEGRGRHDVHDDVDEPARGRDQRERHGEHAEGRRRRHDDEQRAPEHAGRGRARSRRPTGRSARPPTALSAAASRIPSREHEAQLGVGDVEGVLDVEDCDRRTRP